MFPTRKHPIPDRGSDSPFPDLQSYGKATGNPIDSYLRHQVCSTAVTETDTPLVVKDIVNKMVLEDSKIFERITLEGPEPPWMQGPLKVAFLGASGVGRTSILQQFFKHDFPKTHVRTSRRSVYRSCLVCDTCIRELMVIDVPPQRRFPVDNLAEWNNGHPLGLRTVHTYVLVYDMGNLETFQYCRSMRDQILESFNHRDFKIMVVGNKLDLVSETIPHTQELKDISTLVRKHWRCGYVECSAK
ncbi:ras-like protein family member 10B [Armigeres subalbatus]|uniref:ras-like protein family member 10B n=1 Tax=Armigeres subalbatus TaxID=124917 RepID=UPI002ED1E995